MSEQTETALDKGQKFLKHLEAGEFDAAVSGFDKTMKEMMPTEGLGAAWEQVQVQAGKFIEQLEAKSDKQEGYDIVILTLKFERGKLMCRLVYTPEGEIGGLLFAPVD